MKNQTEERRGDPREAGETEGGSAAAQETGAKAESAPEEARSEAGGEESRGSEEELRAEVEALRDRHLRLAAEYDNYRKRTERERLESWNRAQADLVANLLDPLDDLRRFAHLEAENTSVDVVLEGIRMVDRKLGRALESAGLEVLDAGGQRFDPAVHEALMTAPAETPEEDEAVGEVFQPGYRFKGELLRPARVQVRKYNG